MSRHPTSRSSPGRRAASLLLLFMLALAPSAGAEGKQPSNVEPLLDATKLSKDQWDLGEGVSVSNENDMLTLELTGKKYSWAATRERIRYDPEVGPKIVMIERAGKPNVQVEWFGAGGKYLGAAKVADGVKLADRLPKPKDEDASSSSSSSAPSPPESFRLKVWLQGDGARVVFSRLAVVAKEAELGGRDVKWRTPDVQLEHVYDAEAATKTDRGLTLDRDGETLVGKLDGSEPFSAVVFSDRVDYSPDGVVAIDLESVKNGGVSVQALAWDEHGTFLKPVDLIKDIAQPGQAEQSLEKWREQFPDQTKTISFKVYLSGKGAEMKINGIYYGKKQS